MSTISTCPRCSRIVAIPEGLDATALVRCPLCGGEYPLNEATELVIAELIPVGTMEIPPEAAGEGSIIAAPPIVPSFLLRYGDTAEDEESPRHNYDTEETAGARESPLDAEVISLIAKHKEEIEKESPNQAEPSALGRLSQCTPKSELRIFVEVVFGGIVGLTIAYVAMAWLMGSQFPLPSPPKGLKPVLQFVLPDRIWAEKEQPRKK